MKEQNYQSRFTVPMKVKRTIFKKCDECKKRKLSNTFYEVHDQGLMTHIDMYVCKKCMKEAKERVQKMPKCKECGDVIDGNHKTLCEYCREYKEWLKENE